MKGLEVSNKCLVGHLIMVGPMSYEVFEHVKYLKILNVFVDARFMGDNFKALYLNYIWVVPIRQAFVTKDQQ